jgi:hypothetical protein
MDFELYVNCFSVYRGLEFQTIHTSHSRVLRVFGVGTFLALQAASIEVYTRTFDRELSGLLNLRKICFSKRLQFSKSPARFEPPGGWEKHFFLVLISGERLV